MKVTTIDRTSLRQMNSDINKAIQTVAEKYGVSMKTTNSTYSSANATTKVAISVIGENGTVKTPESQNFIIYKEVYGIKKNLGDKFIANGTTYTISGLKPNSRKYPVLGTRADGKVYKFMVETVNR